MITYRITFLDSSTKAPIAGVSVALRAMWGANAWVGESAGSTAYNGQSDGNGQYQIALSDIGIGDSAYTIQGNASVKGYQSTNWVSRTINGNYNDKVISTIKYMTSGASLGNGLPTVNVQDIFGTPSNPQALFKQNENVIIWIIALAILIAVIVLFFVMRGKSGGEPRPRAVIY